jgi:TPR repeat protein
MTATGIVNYIMDLFWLMAKASRDAAKAIEYRPPSSNQQHSNAKVNLSFCFHRGFGANRNALRLAENSKEVPSQGNALHQFNCGLYCYKSHGTLIDFAEASESSAPAAGQGFLPPICAMIHCLRRQTQNERYLTRIRSPLNCVAAPVK